MLLFDDDLQFRQETTALFLQAQAQLGLGGRPKPGHCLRSSCSATRIIRLQRICWMSSFRLQHDTIKPKEAARPRRRRVRPDYLHPQQKLAIFRLERPQLDRPAGDCF